MFFASWSKTTPVVLLQQIRSMPPRIERSTTRSPVHYYMLRGLCGAHGALHGIRKTTKHFYCGRFFARYWQTEVTAPRHPGRWGGRRWAKFTWGEQAILETIVYLHIQRHPTTTLEKIRTELSQFRFEVSRSYLSNLLNHHWGFSWKKPIFQQLQKFSQENIMHYVAFLVFFLTTPWERIKFMDESSFKDNGKYRDSSND